jgi:CHAT domain-containing protein
LRPQAQRRYEVLLGPIQHKIAGAELLVYSPSGNLRGLPIAALHDGTRLLIETRPITTPRTISAFTLPRAALRINSALLVLPPPTKMPLPGASSEIRRVADIYGLRMTLLDDATATRHAFLASVTGHDMIHVATHGQTGSTLYQNAIEFGREHVRAYEVFSLHLTRAPIVMLAACRTSDSSGDPMKVGLADAFLSAGASAVVGSMWEVDDQWTEQLAVGFHRRLAAGATPHDALRGVQLDLLRRGLPVSAWASFRMSS